MTDDAREQRGQILDMTYNLLQADAVAQALYEAQSAVQGIHSDPMFFWAAAFRAAGRALHVHGSKELMFAAIDEAIQLADDYPMKAEKS